jgi:ADP-ribose pyrophosphatase YjhB (NUDIX family)
VKPLLFCASCGARLEEPQHDGARRCSACGRSWYRNPAPTVACVIVREGKALLAVRGGEPHKGKIDVPGGFLHVAEDPLDGLRREIREELGVEIDVGHADYVQSVAHRYEREGEWLVSMGFRARLAGGEPRPSDDVADLRWATLRDVDALDFAWPHDRVLVRKVLQDEGRS